MPEQPPQALSSAFVPEVIKRDSDDDNRSDDNPLHVSMPTHLRCAVAQEGNDKRAEDGSEHRALTTGEAASSDNYGGDDIQLQTQRGGGVAHVQAGKLHDTGEA